MARIRTIKPEFPQSESMGRVSREARLCFILLWTLADDAGRLRGNSRMLASLLYPYDDDAAKRIGGWLSELERENCLVRYEVDGNQYIQIANWLIHQKIDKPSPSKIPAFDEASRILANPRERSSEDLDLGRDQGKEGKGEFALAREVSGLDCEAWDRWLAYRRGIKKPIRDVSAVEAARDMAKLGAGQAAAVAHTIAKGWTGLREPDAKPSALPPKREREPTADEIAAERAKAAAQNQANIAKAIKLPNLGAAR